MRCSNCGGELILKDNTGICINCGSQQKIENAFENIEVCICCIQNDVNGRRTKDSIIATEIYKKLESKNISTFYEYTSAANIVGDDLEMLRHTAIFHSKIIILVGTSTENFSVLYQKHSDDFADKKIIPVVSGIKAEQLPNELRNLQASNFDAVGGLNDLSISILNILGRGGEVELEEIYNRKQKKKKIMFIILISVVVALLSMIIVLAIVFRPKKEAPVIIEEEVVITDNDIYNGAMALLEEEKYLEAADEFNKIPDYKDSKNQIKKIYDRYDGYYQTEDKRTTFYINVLDNQQAEISLEKRVDSKVVHFEGTVEVVENAINSSFVDNYSNVGNIEIILSNTGLSIEIKIEEASGGASFGDNSLEFDLSMRTDSPEVLTVTKEMVDQWMSQKTYFNEITDMGFELEYVIGVGLGADYIDDSASTYKIKDTSIELHFSSFDFLNEEWGNMEWDSERAYIVAVSVPADIVCPSKVGGTDFAHLDDDNVLFISNAEGGFTQDGQWGVSGSAIYAYRANNNNRVEGSSPVFVTSLFHIGKENLCYAGMGAYEAAIKSDYLRNAKDPEAYVGTEMINAEYTNIIVRADSYQDDRVRYYTINLKTNTFEFLREETKER